MNYRTGFIGASTAEATDWVRQKVGDAERICVPFAGTGKDIYSMSGEGRTIESWDTQHYSRCIIDGVFGAEKFETNVDKIRYRKGWTYEARPLKFIDERCAGFIDWVAEEGTLLDKASLASAVVRSTFMGRMTQWHANIEKLWTRFLKAREYNQGFVGIPGKFIHHEGSFFDDYGDPQQYDLMQVDPPKVVIGGDVYSQNFDVLNKMLRGAVDKLPKWTARDSMGQFRKLLEVDTERILFMYVSGVKPPYEDVKKMLTEFGDIEEEAKFPHHGRDDYGLIVRRK